MNFIFIDFNKKISNDNYLDKLCLKDLKNRELRLLERKSQIIRLYIMENVMPEISKAIDKMVVSGRFPNIDPLKELIHHFDSVKDKYN